MPSLEIRWALSKQLIDCPKCLKLNSELRRRKLYVLPETVSSNINKEKETSIALSRGK